MNKIKALILALSISMINSLSCYAWHDETHIAIAKARGCSRWFNAAGADIANTKANGIEAYNHFVNNPPGTLVTPGMVLAQAGKYNQIDPTGHLYGAIIASLREYVSEKRKGKYGEYHLAYCVHYIGDLSQPLHNTLYDDFNNGTYDRIIEQYRKRDKERTVQKARFPNLRLSKGGP